MERRGRNAVLSLVIISGVAVAVAAGFVLERPIVEQWYLWKLDSDDEEERLDGLEKLGEMRSRRAIPRLISIFRRESEDETTRGAAEDALKKIGAPAVPALIEVFKEGDPGTGLAIARLLAEIGVPALPDLVRSLGGQNEAVRVFGKVALLRMGPPVVPTVEALRHEDRFVRAAVAHVLSTAGDQAKPAVPALVDALEDEHDVVRAAASEALGVIDPQGTAVVPALMKLRKDDSGTVRAAVAEALGGAPAEAAVPALIEALSDANASVRVAAARALGTMRSPVVEEATPALARALRDEDERVQESAAEALGQIRASRQSIPAPRAPSGGGLR